MIEGKLVRHHLTPILTDRARGMRDEVAEAKLWYFLCNRRLNGFRFRRNRPLGLFSADFYCYPTKLLIELVTDSQVTHFENDSARTHWANATGHHVLKLRTRDVHEDLVGVLASILKSCCDRTNG